MKLTNSDFVQFVFGNPNGSFPWVTGFTEDPNSSAAKWGGTAVTNGKLPRSIQANSNNFFAISTFKPGPDGKVYRRKENFAECHIIMVDDVGTKVQEHQIQLDPSYKLETSSGNYQYGYLLSAPITDRAQIEHVIDAMVKQGLSINGQDPGMKSVTRYCRLPVGCNTKKKCLIEEDRPFVHQLEEWNPDQKYTLDELIKAFGLDLSRFDTRTHTGTKDPILLALENRGLVKGPANGKPGVWDITCPWVDEHGDRADTGAAYFEPHYNGRAKPGFKCHHGHCENRSIKDVREFIRHSEEARPTAHEEVENPDGLPVIPLIGGELKWQVKQAEQAVLGAGVEVFQRAGVMVRPARVGKEETSGGIKIPSGSLLIVPVRQAWLRTEITASAKWIAYDKREKAWVSRNCPMEISEAYLDRAGDWKLPELAGVIECPTLRRDGSILSKNGYDKETGLYLNANVSVQIPDYSTKRDALRALDVLSEPFSEFPFASKEHRSVAISGVLTGVIRNSLMTAPAHGFDAPQAGSGKTLLADVIAMIVTGKPAAVMSQGVDEVEDEKRLDAMLMRGVGVITIDNSERPVGGQRICQVLTSEKVEARILGHSTVVCVPTNSLILCTGNNLAFAGDMTRRAIICRIEPRTERPDEREFNRDLYRWVPQNRERLVNAALTILSAYHLAGKPKKTYEIAGRLVSVKPYGRFEEWSDWVRGALLWLDQADPLETRGSIDSADPEKIKLQFVLDTWYAAFGGKAMLLREVIDLCTPPRQGLPLTAVYADLRDALLGVARKGNSIDSARLGYYLRSRKERVQGGACFYSDREKVSNSLLWRVNRL